MFGFITGHLNIRIEALNTKIVRQDRWLDNMDNTISDLRAKAARNQHRAPPPTPAQVANAMMDDPELTKRLIAKINELQIK